MKKHAIVLGIAFLPFMASQAFAHGDTHGKAPAVAKKEQKEWGIAGDAKSVNRTITLVMDDAMRFTPNAITVKQGETIRFVVQNKGKLMHEMVIGTRAELDSHAAMMVKFPNMEHDEPYMAHVSAGKKSNLIWNFNKAGEFDFACLIAGHYQAGMTGKITVAARQ